MGGRTCSGQGIGAATIHRKRVGTRYNRSHDINEEGAFVIEKERRGRGEGGGRGGACVEVLPGFINLEVADIWLTAVFTFPREHTSSARKFNPSARARGP